jgi:hypothetical protein
MATTQIDGDSFTMISIAACARSTGTIGRLGTQIMVRLRAVAQSAGLALMLCCASQSALAADSWKEEVLLHDGQKIIVERSQTYGGGREIGQRPPLKELSIAFTLPRSGMHQTWTSEHSEGIGTPDFNLAALHILEDIPYVVVLPNCNSYNKWGRPNPPYVVFKNESSAWTRIPFAELPTEFKDTNLVVESLGNSETLARQGNVSAEMVKQLNARMTQPEYRKIVREQMKPHGGVTSCPIPSTAAAILIGPEIDGQPLYYNWWPLAKEWMSRTYRPTK